MKYLLLLFLCLTGGSAKRNRNSIITLQKFIKANQLFTASLYKEILKNGKSNFLISPYSTQMILSFLQSGSNGDSSTEIRKSLHFPYDKNTVDLAAKLAHSELMKKGNVSYVLHTANKMFVQKTFPINEEFKEIASHIFDVNIENIDFAPPEKVAKIMNDWVEGQTNKKIKNLIKPEDINKDTRTVLINAVYFNGIWLTGFQEYKTQQRCFYKTSRNFINVDMMHHTEEKHLYYESLELDAKFLKLPFEGENISMVIVLPNKNDSLESLENQLDSVFAPKKFQSELVNVALPKFTIENTFELRNILKNLGIRKIFNKSEADLSEIGGKKGDLVVSEAVQKTFIDVSEKGVEAAAATSTHVFFYSLFIDEEHPKEFIADHPFLFYIEAKNFIIFAGKISEPRYKVL